ncbi:MAG: hypothetical protein QS748_10845, partial [Candidatus Endonucleobacter bathymodioli]|nr:hypothetical protein [Candidatus Endonucleobacter bathymodioli]
TPPDGTPPDGPPSGDDKDKSGGDTSTSDGDADLLDDDVGSASRASHRDQYMKGSYRFMNQKEHKRYYGGNVKSEDNAKENMVLISFRNSGSEPVRDVIYDYKMPEGAKIISDNCSSTIGGNSSCSFVIKYDSDISVENIRVRAVAQNGESVDLVIPVNTLDKDTSTSSDKTGTLDKDTSTSSDKTSGWR